MANVNLHKICVALALLRFKYWIKVKNVFIMLCAVMLFPVSHSFSPFKLSFWKLSKPSPSPLIALLFMDTSQVSQENECKVEKINWLDIIRDASFQVLLQSIRWFRFSSSPVITCAGLRNRVRAKAPRTHMHANIFPFQRASKQHRFTFTLSAFPFFPTDCDISFNLNLYPRICHLQNLFFPFCLSSTFVELKN